jgi:hypothetical protein
VEEIIEVTKEEAAAWAFHEDALDLIDVLADPVDPDTCLAPDEE